MTCISGYFLLSKKVRNKVSWRATVTPLASIIGSGFLVVVPLLGHAVGCYAPFAMLAIILLAYAVGAAIRFNIRYAEPILASPTSTMIHRLDYVSDVALGLAYVISVAFYLRLLSSFVLRSLPVFDNAMSAQVLTTLILMTIGISGWKHGLNFLERLEQYSVSIKLAIIGALLIGWLTFDLSHTSQYPLIPLLPSTHFDTWPTIRILAGLLIVVQGFETSRYLGQRYDANLRIVTMRRAQIIAGAIYFVFVVLTIPTFVLLPSKVDETAIVDMSRVIADVLPPLLTLAAIMSQLSAAVADTVGSGGLFAETIGRSKKLTANVGYLVVTAIGVLLVWTTNIFEIISLASRAFAIYYALQCLIAAASVRQLTLDGKERNRLRGVFGGFITLAILLLLVAVIAIPVG